MNEEPGPQQRGDDGPGKQHHDELQRTRAHAWCGNLREDVFMGRKVRHETDPYVNRYPGADSEASDHIRCPHPYELSVYCWAYPSSAC